jgi:low temperature requirement protein LtrA
VVAFGVAGEQFAHLLAEGHFAAGLTAFGLAIFAICWAWINFSWFASAYDTDDWAFRLATIRCCMCTVSGYSRWATAIF